MVPFLRSLLTVNVSDAMGNFISAHFPAAGLTPPNEPAKSSRMQADRAAVGDEAAWMNAARAGISYRIPRAFLAVR